MAALNPPRVIPGLGRSIVNFLLENRKEWDDAALVDVFKPQGVNDAEGAADGVKNTLSAFRAIGILELAPGGLSTVARSVAKHGKAYGRAEFRSLMLKQVLDLDRDGDPWAVSEGDAYTRGARDLSRALSWFLAQDALGEPLRWADNVERLQASQFATTENGKWALINDTRWNAFSRWAPALGLAVPAVVRSTGAPGLVPLPTVAIADVVATLPGGRIPIFDFLSTLAQRIPVLPDGVIRRGLVNRLGGDPDPGVLAHAIDSSLSQVLRLLESRGVFVFETLADADGVQLSVSDQARTTHVTLNGSKKG